MSPHATRRVFTVRLALTALACFAIAHASRAEVRAQPSAPRTRPTALALSRDGSGIGFDDMRTDPDSRAVFVPAGVTGRVYAIDPGTHALTAFDGFAHGAVTTGHSDGPTSVDFGPGVLFVADRTSRTIDLVDRATRAIVAHVALGAGPDYVRYIAATHEIWVTEPSAHRIEVFDLAPFTTRHASPTLTTVIAIPGGPESLEIDPVRGRAYTNVWTGARTLAIDLASHAVRENWVSGCRDHGTQGLQIDVERAQLFVGCDDGTVTTLDVAHGGALLSHVATPGTDVDIIAYNRTLHHLYIPSSDGGTLSFVGVAPSGTLTLLGHASAAVGTHCAATDHARTAFVCDPRHGAVLAIDDPYPAS